MAHAVNASEGKPDQSETNTVTIGSAAATSSVGETVRISKLEVLGNDVGIEFEGGPVRTYVLQARDSWTTGEWGDITSTVTDEEGHGLFKDVGAARRPMRFYRVRSP